MRMNVVFVFQSCNENERGGRQEDVAAVLQTTQVRGNVLLSNDQARCSAK